MYAVPLATSPAPKAYAIRVRVGVGVGVGVLPWRSYVLETRPLPVPPLVFSSHHWPSNDQDQD